MAPRRVNARSSLADHTFPPFYACYLLKSIRTPRSNATYIGSTPNPPRRIRQHNGEISQGAWKTQRSRPWVMQMIVHGFPSKLAALQFEWAWQHPHLSRHLKDDKGANLFTSPQKYFKTSVLVARTMLASHPYSSWPLHVKLFTEEAAKAWNEVSRKIDANGLPLPRGFTHATELEGVDGKSGLKGTGRTGPIDVTDDTFTSLHLEKYKGILNAGAALRCMVCSAKLHDPLDPSEIALCPNGECTSVAHLTCLAQDFLSQTEGHAMIPRGGTCRSCHTYVLWGDIIKGCYRLKSGGVGPLPADEDDEERAGAAMDVSEDDDEPAEQVNSSQTSPRKRTTQKVSRKKANRSRGRGKTKEPAEDVGEFFDIDAVSEIDEQSELDGVPSPRTKPQSRAGTERGRKKTKAKDTTRIGQSPPPLVSFASTSSGKPAKRGRPKKVPQREQDDEREFFDLSGISAASESDGEPGPAKSKRMPTTATKGRPNAGLRQHKNPPTSPKRKGFSEAVAATPSQQMSTHIGTLRPKGRIAKDVTVDFFQDEDIDMDYQPAPVHSAAGPPNSVGSDVARAFSSIAISSRTPRSTEQDVHMHMPEIIEISD